MFDMNSNLVTSDWHFYGIIFACDTWWIYDVHLENEGWRLTRRKKKMETRTCFIVGKKIGIKIVRRYTRTFAEIKNAFRLIFNGLFPSHSINGIKRKIKEPKQGLTENEIIPPKLFALIIACINPNPSVHWLHVTPTHCGLYKKWGNGIAHRIKLHQQTNFQLMIYDTLEKFENTRTHTAVIRIPTA